ncbi:class I SAM-dependent methyltransferase [Nocardioidaceae bacterium SCSIO 66511]|nr:class I SAM-dependent methyltransferase [Nocardioidaceae bacterium SCSIO 66511]
MTKRALSFGAVADAYERYRPGYPDELVEAVITYDTGRPRTALEIGAGTGKATRAFVKHGIDVLATERDPDMLAVLRREVPAAATAQATLEELSVTSTYDLVYVAAALHWTDPATRWQRIATLLRPGGTFASFGGPFELADAADQRALDEARRPYVADDAINPPVGDWSDAEMRWPGSELERTDLFADVRQVVIERSFTTSADDYVAHLATISAYLQLPPAELAALLDACRRALPETVEVSADVDLHLARRAGPG